MSTAEGVERYALGERIFGRWRPALSLLRFPASERVQQRIFRLRREVLFAQLTGGVDGLLELLQVARAMWTDRKVCLEAAALSVSQRVFEVAGDELDHLTAGEAGFRARLFAGPAEQAAKPSGALVL